MSASDRIDQLNPNDKIRFLELLRKLLFYYESEFVTALAIEYSNDSTNPLHNMNSDIIRLAIVTLMVMNEEKYLKTRLLTIPEFNQLANTFDDIFNAISRNVMLNNKTVNFTDITDLFLSVSDLNYLYIITNKANSLTQYIIKYDVNNFSSTRIAEAITAIPNPVTFISQSRDYLLVGTQALTGEYPKIYKINKSDLTIAYTYTITTNNTFITKINDIKYWNNSLYVISNASNGNYYWMTKIYIPNDQILRHRSYLDEGLDPLKIYNANLYIAKNKSYVSIGYNISANASEIRLYNVDSNEALTTYISKQFTQMANKNIYSKKIYFDGSLLQIIFFNERLGQHFIIGYNIFASNSIFISEYLINSDINDTSHQFVYDGYVLWYLNHNQILYGELISFNYINQTVNEHLFQITDTKIGDNSSILYDTKYLWVIDNSTTYGRIVRLII